MNLHTFCKSCAGQLQIQWTLLLILGKRPCDGCGTVVGYDFVSPSPGQPVLEWGSLLAPYNHVWAYDVWPIAWGVVLQDRYGTHVHEWSTTYYNHLTGEHRQACRCKARRTRTSEEGIDQVTAALARQEAKSAERKAREAEVAIDLFRRAGEFHE